MCSVQGCTSVNKQVLCPSDPWPWLDIASMQDNRQSLHANDVQLMITSYNCSASNACVTGQWLGCMTGQTNGAAYLGGLIMVLHNEEGQMSEYDAWQVQTKGAAYLGGSDTRIPYRKVTNKWSCILRGVRYSNTMQERGKRMVLNSYGGQISEYYAWKGQTNGPE